MQRPEVAAEEYPSAPRANVCQCVDTQSNLNLDSWSFTVYYENPDGSEVARSYRFDNSDDFLIEYLKNRYEILYLKAQKRLVSVTPLKLWVTDVTNTVVKYSPVWPDDIEKYSICTFHNGNDFRSREGLTVASALDIYTSYIDEYFNDYVGRGVVFTTYLSIDKTSHCLVASRIYDGTDYQELYNAKWQAGLLVASSEPAWLQDQFKPAMSGCTLKELSRSQ
jgi:hypothetical protein